MLHNTPLEIQIKERHIYSWTCPQCTEENRIELSILVCNISCAICGLTVRREEIASTRWTLPNSRIRRQREQEAVELEFTRS